MFYRLILIVSFLHPGVSFASKCKPGKTMISCENVEGAVRKGFCSKKKYDEDKIAKLCKAGKVGMKKKLKKMKSKQESEMKEKTEEN